MSHIELIDDICDRCGKLARVLRPYRFSRVVYRRRHIDKPWLCTKCFWIEKHKSWRRAKDELEETTCARGGH